ncbi:MAG: alpha/beta hydrolase [Bacteroidales bacterium]|nr:alpha/beta hydrolase [Bacteroidales bacterium]
MRQYLLICILFLSAAGISLSAGNYRTESNIPYSTSEDPYARERCKLDIYYPEDASGAPAVVWFHGGGLTGGQKFIPEQLKESGIIVVAVNYRLLPECELSDCIDDAAAAVAWAFGNIEKFGGSSSRIFVSGHSAGGYLTSMIGLDRKWLTKYGVDADSIAALVPFSGQAITHFAYRRQKGMSELQPCIDEFAPLYWVRPDSAPYIIITGDSEMELYGRYEENAYMWRMMKLTGHPDTEIYKLDGYDHGAMAAPAFHILKNTIRRIAGRK